MTSEITLRVNGTEHRVAVDDPTCLCSTPCATISALRGPKFGCGLGQCGACAVLIDGWRYGRASRAPSTPKDRQITTLEGLGSPEQPSRVQAAFIAEQAAQCGYCTNGMIMTATALLSAPAASDEGDVREALAQNLCRCGSHVRVLAAVMRAAREG